jgi:16S rRNA (adenine1518-N6/adenine1519-N6)-dimethyltransferase
VLKFEPKLIDYFVVANIPYYITSPILAHFLYDISHTPQKMLIMMQKEVGERILEGRIKEKSGLSKSPDLEKIKQKSSVLSLIIAKKCRVEKVVDVSKTAFNPAPKVDSIVLAFEKHDLFQDTSDESFLDFIKTCFAQPRKKLLNNLVSGGYEKDKVFLALRELSLSDTVR